MVYSNDLRWRIVHLRLVENKREPVIARYLNVSLFTVRRIVERFLRYGHVRPARIGRPDISSLLTRAQLLVLMEYILSNSTAYLQDMERYLRATTGSTSNLVGIHRVLKRYGYSRKQVFKNHVKYNNSKIKLKSFHTTINVFLNFRLRKLRCKRGLKKNKFT